MCVYVYVLFPLLRDGKLSMCNVLAHLAAGTTLPPPPPPPPRCTGKDWMRFTYSATKTDCEKGTLSCPRPLNYGAGLTMQVWMC